MNYAFIDIAQEFQVLSLDKFLKTTGSKVSYIHSTSEVHFYGDFSIFEIFLKEIKKDNPTLVHKEVTEYLFLDNLKELIKVPWVISTSDLLNYKHIESMSMRLMDRSSLIPISGFSRRRIYLLLLNYFQYIIENNNIEGLIVFDTPHSFHSHIFFELCKYKKLKIIKMEYHFHNDYSLILDRDLCPIVPKEYNQNTSISELEKLIPKGLFESVYENSKYLVSFKEKETKAIVKKGIFSTFLLIFKYLDKCAKNLIMGVFPFLFKKEMLHFSSLNNISNRLKYRLVLNGKLYKLVRLNIFYNKIAQKNINIEDKFIFVGLHMQPEKTSQPMGEEYDNQLIMIKILADSAPEGCKIYVKEHPNQFNVKKVPNRHYRDKFFYESLSEIKNVVFVPLEFDSLSLIDKSIMVATVTGTSGWEAITRSKAVLVFGNAYYVGCRAVRKITSVETCKIAIKELLLLKSDDDFRKEIYKYVLYYYENNFLVKSANWHTLFKLNSLSYLSQIDNIVDKLVYFHNKNKI